MNKKFRIIKIKICKFSMRINKFVSLIISIVGKRCFPNY